MNDWASLAITVSLAVYGWRLITQLAKRREAYDLYCSIILLVEQLETDSIKVWIDRLDDLDEYTELKLLSKLVIVELKLQFIQQHYRFQRTPEVTIIDSSQIANLRSYLTKPPDSVLDEQTRFTYVHRLTATMVKDLLEACYEGINKRRWLPF